MHLADFEAQYHIPDLIVELPKLDRARWAAMRALVIAKMARDSRELELEIDKSVHLTDGSVTGSNDAQRRANLALQTEDSEVRVLKAKREELEAEVTYKAACGAYDTVKTLLQLATALIEGGRTWQPTTTSPSPKKPGLFHR